MNKKLLLLIMMFTVGTLLNACSSTDTKTVVVASKPHAEQYVLAEMLTLMIENHTDIQVAQKLGIGGGTSNIQPAVLAGEIDIYPEYTGTGWLFVLKNENIQDSNELYLATKDEYLEKFNVQWLGLYGFNNTYALAMKRELAEELNITTYSELAEKSNELVFGAEYDFYERDDGFEGLDTTYNFTFREKRELDIGLKYEALAQNQIQVINAFSTDGLIQAYDLKVLIDDLNYFPSYYAATIIRQETLDKYPELEGVLSKLDGQISNEEMTYLNYLVENENEDPKEVAKNFLQEKGLL